MMSMGDQRSIITHITAKQSLAILRTILNVKITNHFKAKNNFSSPDAIAMILYAVGFVTQKKCKQELVIVHVFVLDYDPSIGYTDQYMFQVAVIPGKIKDIDSYLLPIVDEVKSLGEYGLIVKKHNGEIIKSKVHMIMATGDIPQISKYINYKGICSVKGESPASNAGVMYYPDSKAALRPMSEFTNGNIDTQITGPIFSSLPSFCRSLYFGIDELHLSGQGIGRLILRLIVDVNKLPNQKHSYYHRFEDGSANISGYTFKESFKYLESAGNMIQESRKNIPTSFQGSWDNLVSKLDGARAIDFLDLLLYVVPTLIVPVFARQNVRTALLDLLRERTVAL